MAPLSRKLQVRDDVECHGSGDFLKKFCLRRKVPSLYGSAANSEVLMHTRLNVARAFVVTVLDEAAAELIVATERRLASEIPIIFTE